MPLDLVNPFEDVIVFGKLDEAGRRRTRNATIGAGVGGAGATYGVMGLAGTGASALEHGRFNVPSRGDWAHGFHPKTVGSNIKQAAKYPGGKGKLAALAGTGATVGAGTGLLMARKKNKQIGKRYKVAVPPQSSTVIRAITPTGRHVSHANALGHWTGPSSGGHATRLERYTPRKGGKMGVGHKKATLLHVGKSLAGGFEALGKIPKVKKVPTAPKSGLGDRLKNGPIQPPSPGATPDAQPSVFSLKRTSGKAIAGGTAGGIGLGAYGLHRHNQYERGQGALASKALAPVTPPAVTALKPTKPLLAKSPVVASGPTSKLNSNMPAAAKTGRRLP